MVDGGGLENRFPERGRGFESYSLRHAMKNYWTQMNADKCGFMATKYSHESLTSRTGKGMGTDSFLILLPEFKRNILSELICVHLRPIRPEIRGEMTELA